MAKRKNCVCIKRWRTWTTHNVPRRPPCQAHWHTLGDHGSYIFPKNYIHRVHLFSPFYIFFSHLLINIVFILSHTLVHFITLSSSFFLFLLPYFFGFLSSTPSTKKYTSFSKTHLCSTASMTTIIFIFHLSFERVL